MSLRDPPIGALCCLVATSDEDIKLRTLPSSDDVVARLIENNEREFTSFRLALRAFADAHPGSAAAGHDVRCRDVLRRAFAHTPCCEVGVPTRRRLDNAPSGAAMRRVLGGATS